MSRKIASILLAVIIASVMAFALVGCGDDSKVSGGGSENGGGNVSNGGSEPSDFAGKYTIVSMEIQGSIFQGDNLEDSLKEFGGTAENYIDILDGGNLIIQIGGITSPMTYTANSNILTAKDISRTLELVVEGNTITCKFPDDPNQGEGSGYTAIFKKQ